MGNAEKVPGQARSGPGHPDTQHPGRAATTPCTGIDPWITCYNRRMRTEETTALLLDRIHAGDMAARDALIARYLPLLRRWARGRLPVAARDLGDTEDLVQITLIRGLGQVGSFEYGGAGSFLAYLRSTLMNLLRNEIRRAGRRGQNVQLDEVQVESQATSPLERAMGAERMERYEAALAALPKRARELIIMRLEFGMDYADMAMELESTPDAVRMATRRATEMLARQLGSES